MKRILFAIAAVMVLAASCTKEETPTLSFDKQVYVLQADGTVDVRIEVSKAPAASVSVPLTIGGAAVKGQDYTISAEALTIAAGETTGSVTVAALNNFTASDIALSFTAPAGYNAGKYTSATVTVEAKDRIVYSFATATATVLDSYTVKLNLSGVETGSSFIATADMEIPVLISGDTDCVVIEDQVIRVAKGSNVGTIVVKAGDMDFGDEAEVFIGVDTEKLDSRFVAGETSVIALDIQGSLKLSNILGIWKFEEVIDGEELAMWFEEMEDDSSLCPLENDGFSFLIDESKDDEGNVVGYKFVPNSTGAFANYFREADITYTAPMNMTSDGEIVGDYSSIEGNMFVFEVDEDYLYNTYFKLSNVNRAFDSATETLGEGVISLSFDADGNLILSFHDYDTPPFGFNWWEDGKFDADMFGFASRFSQKK